MSESKNLGPFVGLSNVYGRKRMGMKLFDVLSPIQRELTDPDDVRHFFDKWNLIPYSGINRQSSQALCDKLLEMPELSNTHGACIHSVINYSFSGRIKFVRGGVGEFDIDEDEVEVPIAERREFIDWINEIELVGLDDWHEVIERMSRFYDSTGDIWAECIAVMRSDGGVDKFLKIHRCDEVLFVKKDSPEEDDIVAISKIWRTDYLEKYPPRTVPIYPTIYQYEEEGVKVLRTMVHKKNGIGRLYGRPESLGAIVDMFSEFRLKEYVNKQIHRGWIAPFLCELEEDEVDPLSGDDGDEDGESFADRLEQNFSNIGDDPMAGMFITRPAGAEPFKLERFPKMDIHEFFHQMQEDVRSAIIMAHDWSEKLLSLESASGFSENIFKDIFEIKQVTKVLRRQKLINRMCDKITNAFKAMEEREGEFEGIRWKTQSALQALLDEKKEEAERIAQGQRQRGAQINVSNE